MRAQPPLPRHVPPEARLAAPSLMPISTLGLMVRRRTPGLGTPPVVAVRQRLAHVVTVKYAMCTPKIPMACQSLAFARQDWISSSCNVLQRPVLLLSFLFSLRPLGHQRNVGQSTCTLGSGTAAPHSIGYCAWLSTAVPTWSGASRRPLGRAPPAVRVHHPEPPPCVDDRVIWPALACIWTLSAQATCPLSGFCRLHYFQVNASPSCYCSH